MQLIGFVLALPQAFAENKPSSTVDIGMAEVSRTNLDAFSGMRWAPATLPLVSKYQASASAFARVDNGTRFHAAGSIVDSSTGPIALGLHVEYATGEAPLSGEALPGWRLPEETLIRDYADVGLTAAGGVSFLNRQYGVGMSASYFGRTYITRVENENMVLSFLQDNTEQTRVHQLELNGSVSGKFADMLVVAAGVNDWLAISSYRKPFASVRFGVVDTPRQMMYENMGGVELDIEGAWGQDGFGLGMLGAAGDIRISEIVLRTGYRYDFLSDTHHPALGFGLDDGRVSLDYGLQLGLQSTINEHWHSVGVRFRI